MDDTSECGRHRKPWHLLTDNEKMLYVTGFKALRNNGILDIFIETHHLSDTPLQFADVHYTGQFFPWHSYFLTEIESQIRNLGDKYKCFSLPYWDFTVDSGYSHANDMPIYQSVLGQDGNENNDYCVEDELWNRDVYPTTYLCSETEKSLGINCCLKRHKGLRGHIPDANTLAPHIYSYRRWRDFQNAVVKEHTYVHGYVSGNCNKTHMFGHNAAEDPLFIMLHNFLMYIRALRTTCFGYDKVINELEQYQPYSYDPYQADRAADMKPYLDVPMDFNILADQEWARVNKEDITIRKVFDLKEFDITYELGTFWHTNARLQQYCIDNLNKTWFYDTVDINSIVNDALLMNNNILDTKSNVDYQYIIYGMVFLVLLFFVIIRRFINKFGDKDRRILEEDHCDNEYGTF